MSYYIEHHTRGLSPEQSYRGDHHAYRQRNRSHRDETPTYPTVSCDIAAPLAHDGGTGRDRGTQRRRAQARVQVLCHG